MIALLLRPVVVFAAGICWTLPSFAAETCDGRVAGAISHIGEAIAFFGRNEQCRAYRFVTPHYTCRLSYSFQHGPGGFSCGPGLSGVWGARDGRSTGAARTVMGIDRKVDLPDHDDLRRQWLAPIDTEGMYKNYPVQLDEYVDYYPRRLTVIGSRKSLKNEGAVQTYQYVTMNREARAAVAGNVSAGCVGMYFIDWTSPDLSAEVEAKMITFLEDLRLEAVRLSGEDAAEMCRQPL